MSGDGHALRTDKLTLDAILQLGYAAYERRHPLPAMYVGPSGRCWRVASRCSVGTSTGVRRGMWNVSGTIRVGTGCAAMGVGAGRTLARQAEGLSIGLEHYHVIFTMPHELNELWLAKVEGMSHLRFASVHDTLRELLGDGKSLGATPGILAALHTWSQTLRLHPHLPCLVTGGGLREAGQWVAVHNGFWLPMGVVMALFRGKLCAAIRQGVAHGMLQLPQGPAPAAVRASAQPAGPPEVARPHPGSLSLWAGGAHLPGPLSTRGATFESAVARLRWPAGRLCL